MNQDPLVQPIMDVKEDYMLKDGDAGKQIVIYVPPSENEIQNEPPRGSLLTMNQDLVVQTTLDVKEDYMLEDGDAGKQIVVYVPPSENELHNEPPRGSCWKMNHDPAVQPTLDVEEDYMLGEGDVDKQMVLYNPPVESEVQIEPLRGSGLKTSPDPVDLPVLDFKEDYMLEDGDAGKQIVLYVPPVESEVQTEPPRRLPIVGTYVAQCGRCFRWRIVPNAEMYEHIRAHLTEKPFVCESALEWGANILCEAPTDISVDGSRLWAFDKPGIPQPPPGWRRVLKIRSPGATRFGDVHYTAPEGTKLRSGNDVKKFLSEHPEYTKAGVQECQFSFSVPNPLHGNYVSKLPRKKPAHDPNARTSPAADPNAATPPLFVEPLSCSDPEEHKDFVHDEQGSSASYPESSSRPKSRPKKIAKISEA